MQIRDSGHGPQQSVLSQASRVTLVSPLVEFKEERLKQVQGEDPALGTGGGREDAERGACQKPNFCTVWKV